MVMSLKGIKISLQASFGWIALLHKQTDPPFLLEWFLAVYFIT